MNTTDINDSPNHPSNYRTNPLTNASVEATSAVSWRAIFAGATASAAISLILVLLGTGLGMTLVSPWAMDSERATTLGISSILWITFMSLIASALGGYLAGRLRTKWTSTLADEVYFRDTAHGFLAWAVATLLTAALLTSTIGTIVKGDNLKVATKTVRHAGEESTKYFLDLLFRPNTTAANANSTDTTTATVTDNGNVPGTLAVKDAKAEVKRILIKALEVDSLSDEDLAYAGQLVSRHTAITQQAAQQRVGHIYQLIQSTKDTAEAAAKEAADKARKASAYASLWLFISLLIGAFIASFAATYGGRQRDL